MKTIISVFALATTIALGAEIAPSPNPDPDQAPGAPAADQSAQDSTEQAARAAEKAARVQERALRQATRAQEQATKQAARMQEQAIRQAERAVQLAQSGHAAGEEMEPPELDDVADGGDLVINNGQTSFSFAGAPHTYGMGQPLQPLIVRNSELDSGAVSNIQEDLTVMSRILNRTVEREFGREGRDSALGIVISTLPGARRPQSIYLEGYGALFLMNVKFPLVAPPAKDEEKAEKSADTTWEKTKQELYGTGPGSSLHLWNVNVNAVADGNVEYNAERVESLKKGVIEALKNAANIRTVKPDESITVAIGGNRAGSATSRVKYMSKTTSSGAHKPQVLALDSGRNAGRESTLTIRVKKSDVDAFAKGTLGLDEFTKRASISAY